MTRDIHDAVIAGQRGAVTIGSQLRPPFDCLASARLPLSVRGPPADSPEHHLAGNLNCGDVVSKTSPLNSPESLGAVKRTLLLPGAMRSRELAPRGAMNKGRRCQTVPSQARSGPRRSKKVSRANRRPSMSGACPGLTDLRRKPGICLASVVQPPVTGCCPASSPDNLRFVRGPPPAGARASA